MHAWNGWMHGDGWGLGMIGMTLVWIVLAVVLVLAVRAMVGGGGGGGGRDGRERPESPLDILKRRYARGEIDRDEFERMRRELG